MVVMLGSADPDTPCLAQLISSTTTGRNLYSSIASPVGERGNIYSMCTCVHVCDNHYYRLPSCETVKS